MGVRHRQGEGKSDIGGGQKGEGGEGEGAGMVGWGLRGTCLKSFIYLLETNV